MFSAADARSGTSAAAGKSQEVHVDVHSRVTSPSSTNGGEIFVGCATVDITDLTASQRSTQAAPRGLLHGGRSTRAAPRGSRRSFVY